MALLRGLVVLVLVFLIRFRRQIGRIGFVNGQDLLRRCIVLLHGPVQIQLRDRPAELGENGIELLVGIAPLRIIRLVVHRPIPPGPGSGFYRC